MSTRMMMNLFRQQMELRGLRAGGWPIDNRDEMLRMIRTDELGSPIPDTSDFWEVPGNGTVLSPFQEVAEQHDLELLLEMAAKDPGNNDAWVKKFLFCRNAEVHVPAHGRNEIASMVPAFFSGSGASMEGLEVMVMYGYELKQGDFDFFCEKAAEDPLEYMPLLKFCLLHSRRLVGDGRRVGRTDMDMDKAAPLQINLDRALGIAIGGIFLFDGARPSSLELARLLLRAGADPNGTCFHRVTEFDFTPALYQAIGNQDEEMVRLLLQYGADAGDAARRSGRFTGQEPGVFTIMQAATEHGMSELVDESLSASSTSASPTNKPDLQGLLKELRDEITQPLKLTVSGILVVAMMRITGKSPPVGVVSSTITSFCNFLDY